MFKDVKRKTPVGLGKRFFGFVLLVGLLGCPAPTKPTANDDSVDEVAAPPPLSLLIVDTPDIAPLITRQWSARRDGKLTTTEMSVEQFRSNDYQAVKQNDVVIYPIELIGELVKRELVQEVPKSIWDSEEFNKKGLFRKSRTRLVRFGSSAWGTPLGSPQLVLMYRQDVLEQLGVKPPRTWQEFFKLTKRLREADLKDAEGKALPTAVDIPMNEQWASVSFLAMCAADIRYRGKISTVFDIDDMNPLVNQKPFVQKLVAVKEVVDEDDFWMTPADAYRRILDGESAMAIGWPSAGLLDEPAEVNRSVRIARLPGSDDWFDFEEQLPVRRDDDEPIHVDSLGFDGRMASVSTTSAETRESFEFISWLANKQIGLLFLPESASGAPFRASHLGNVERWTGPGLAPEAVDAYVEILRATDKSNTSFIFPRIPEVKAYRHGMDAAITSCLSGEIEPQAALDRVVEQWKTITDNQGQAKQRSWLKKSEGF